MSPAARIIRDVLVYRLRKLEMANLVAAVAIMVTLRLPLPDILIRTVFAALLNLLAYLNNDYCDIDRDLASGRESEKTRFLAGHRATARRAQLALVTLLSVLALAYRPELLVAVLAGGGICWAYSARLKEIPYADILAMTVWGVAMTLVAFPFDDPVGWALVCQLGLFSSVFETIQVLRDHDDDRADDVTTTAVRLGPVRTLWLARAFMVVAAAYGILMLHRFLAVLMLAAPLVPFTPADVERYWTRVRLIFGLTWLAILAWIFATGSPAGLVFHPG